MNEGKEGHGILLTEGENVVMLHKVLLCSLRVFHKERIRPEVYIKRSEYHKGKISWEDQH